MKNWEKRHILLDISESLKRWEGRELVENVNWKNVVVRHPNYPCIELLPFKNFANIVVTSTDDVHSLQQCNVTDLL